MLGANRKKTEKKTKKTPVKKVDLVSRSLVALKKPTPLVSPGLATLVGVCARDYESAARLFHAFISLFPGRWPTRRP